MSNKIIKFGLIGAGAIAQTHVQAFEHLTEGELVAVCDTREEAANATADARKCSAFTCIDEMLEKSELDAVIICTPPSTHEDIATKCMEQGLHVLCEKPLAIDSESAREMVNAAKTHGVTFTMASKFRYVKDVIETKAIISSGVLGDIVLFENTFTGKVDMTSRWNSDPKISGGGVLVDNGTHSVDIIRYLLGPLAEVQAIEGKRIQNLPVEDTLKLFARTESGVMASVDLSWSLHKPIPDFISIYGTGGSIHCGWQESKYRRNGDKDWTIIGSGYDKVDAFTRQLNNFIGAIRGEEELLITPEDAIASVGVIESAYEAMWRDTWVKIPARQTSDAPVSAESV